VYDSYGRRLSGFESVLQPYSYTGREYDVESGLYFYRARYFDANTGRFLSKDPIGFDAADQNLYRYVFNNPSNFEDPLGLDFTVCRYPGPIPHVGIGVNSPNTLGKRPKRQNSDKAGAKVATGNDVPGEVSPDKGEKQCTNITTSPTEDQEMKEYIQRNIENPGNYNGLGNSCVDFVRDGLEEVLGLELSDTNFPRTLFDEIRTQAPNR